LKVQTLKIDHHSQKAFIMKKMKSQFSFVETTHVAEGVECEVYTFVENEGRDLGIIKIEPGMKTPLQKVLKGEKTIEGYLSGKGKLTITKPDGTQEVFVADGLSEKPSYCNC
jgi:hypothetical protein